MELKTANEIRNDVAESYGAGHWVDLLNEFKNGNITFKDMKECVDEAMKLHSKQIAEAACKEQLDLVIEEHEWKHNDFEGGYIHTSAILRTQKPNIDKLLK